MGSGGVADVGAVTAGLATGAFSTEGAVCVTPGTAPA